MSLKPSLFDYWIDIYENRVLLAIVVAVAAAFAYLVSLSLPKLYESKTVFYSPANVSIPNYTGNPGGVTLAQGAFVPTPEEKAASISIGILRSKDVARQLQKEFPHLNDDQLRKNIDVVAGREFMIEVYVRDRDPQRAQAIARRVPEIFREFHRSRIAEHMDNVRRTAQEQLTMVEARLAELRSGTGRAPQAGLGGPLEPRADQRTGAPPLDVDLRGSTDDRLRQTAERLRSLVLEATLQAREPATPVVVVEQAAVPRSAMFPLPVLNAIVAAITGLGLGIYYCMFVGYLKRTRIGRIERGMQVPVFTQNELSRIVNLAKSR